MPLLKVMLSTACERGCLYCAFRAGSNCCRITFKPDELARAFLAVQRARVVDGLFLSSGILRGGANTQNRLLDTVEIVRRAGFRGYLHLKIMPGAERGQVLRAMELADRVSVNLEAPTPERLQRLAPEKEFRDELLAPLRWVEEARRENPARRVGRDRWPSSTTQFVVGPAGESDLEILSTTAWLMRQLRLARCYFMAFTPVEGTPLENHPAEDPLREHRLYQASFLLQTYGFDLEDLPFGSDGRLPLAEDPKTAYARARLSEAPVEVNRAERGELLRVPGIGPRSAEAILRARRLGRLRELQDLRRLGVVSQRAAPFITLDGRQPSGQLRLF
ncbi:MAG: radical SAM protein [Chloroflexota bacterium]